MEVGESKFVGFGVELENFLLGFPPSDLGELRKSWDLGLG